MDSCHVVCQETGLFLSIKPINTCQPVSEQVVCLIPFVAVATYKVSSNVIPFHALISSFPHLLFPGH